MHAMESTILSGSEPVRLKKKSNLSLDRDMQNYSELKGFRSKQIDLKIGSIDKILTHLS